MDAVAGTRVAEWRQVTLGDVLEVQHGFPFRGEFFDLSGAHVLLTPKNFKRTGGLDVSEGRCKRYSGPTDKRYVLDEGDIVVAMTDLKQDAPILGSTGVVPAEGRYLHNQRIGKVVIRDPDRLHRPFVPWLLNSPTVRKGVRATATGATVRHTAPSRICAIRAYLPSIDGQRRIAAVLSAFDEMIEINERRIDLLGDLARSLYREWFVHFRFPGHEDAALFESELGPIPEGWEVRSLGEMCSLSRSGGTPKRSALSNWENGAIPWFKTGELRDGPLFDSLEHITAEAQARTFEPPAILMAIYGSPTVGRLGWLTQPSSCNQAAIAMRAHDPDLEQDWLWYELESLRDRFNAMAQGAAQQNISKQKVVESRVRVPTAGLLQDFAVKVRPMRGLWQELAASSRQLAATRDLLLPRLVTGRLDISDIDLGVLTPLEVE